MRAIGTLHSSGGVDGRGLAALWWPSRDEAQQAVLVGECGARLVQGLHLTLQGMLGLQHATHDALAECDLRAPFSTSQSGQGPGAHLSRYTHALRCPQVMPMLAHQQFGALAAQLDNKARVAVMWRAPDHCVGGGWPGGHWFGCAPGRDHMPSRRSRCEPARAARHQRVSSK